MDQPFQYGLTPPAMTNVNGVMPVMNLAALQKQERQQAEIENTRQEIHNLAGHVRNCWSEAQQAKLNIEPRLLQAIRQRRGEYDPELLSAIRQQGGSEVYMMLTSNKCRAAKSWLTDTLLGNGADKPWTLAPTKMPDLSPADKEAIVRTAAEEAMALEKAMGVEVGSQDMANVMQKVKARVNQANHKKAKELVQNMENKMEDQLAEGNFIFAFTQFLDDLVTFPSAILKGPVIRKKPQMQWVETNGQFNLEVKDTLVKEWERVDPFMLYPAPGSSSINEGYLIERHRLSRAELEAYRGVEGYSDAAINAVLDEYGTRGLHDWLMIDTQKAHVEDKLSPSMHSNPEGLIDALQFWGSIQGKQLREWGMSAEDVPEELKEYDCEVWLIGTWVIKATLNYDPFKRKPYFKASYEEIPGTFWGNGIPDLIRDCAAVCNAAARALVNNMGIASGPQVDVNVDRLPKGENITKLYPWKIWQTKSDPYSSTAPAVNFFQPNMMAQELMGIYEKFSVMADEYSSIPRYLTGDAGAGGAGRTASGLSMLMSNAGKGIKQVISNIDQYVLGPALERLYFHNMKYEDDPSLKGDVRIIARGANSLVVKEQAMLRRNEFLQIVLNSDRVAQVVGNEGLAALLREGVKSLDMDTDAIVPSADMLKAQENMMLQAQKEAQAAMPAQGATLQDGAPVTNNFRPMERP
jgi:hypothetical protein